MNKKSIYKSNSCEKILSVNLTTLSKKEILQKILLRAKQKKQTVIFTPNTQILLRADKNKNESMLLNSASINIPDGIGVVIASRINHGKIKNRISGIDIAEKILLLSQKAGYKIFLLGGSYGVAKKAKKNLCARYPKLKICGTHHGYFDKSGKENEALIKAINRASPDIIFVCMGYPLQEKWIIQNKNKLHSVKILIGLGGSLDVWSGKARRAPMPLQIIGLEWLYRTIKEPRRAKIFLDIPRFLCRALQDKYKA